MSDHILNEGYNKKNNLFIKGSGSKIYNKSKLIDLSFSAGALLLGHHHNVFVKAINYILKKKISNFAAPNIYAKDYSRKIKQTILNSSKIIFCNSGTEAIIKSLRIVKALNNKKKIVNVTGSWHGSVDKLLFFPNQKLKPQFLSAGLSEDDKKNLIFIPYNDIKNSKKILDKNINNISCILIEPIQASLPTYQAKSYLKFLSNYSKKNNIILIFDETITGLRTNGSSVQKFYNIKADISILGKCFGGGFPIGIISISKKIETKLRKEKIKVFFGGTFSGNPISMLVGIKIFDFVQKNKKKIFHKINKNSIYFQNKMNIFFDENKLDLKIYRFESILRIVFSKSKILNRVQRDFFENKKDKKITMFKKYIEKNKIYYPQSGIIFVSEQTTKKDLNFVIKVLKRASLIYFK
jgi:glutamate-1-semialdehyde 2,1-aminomutase